MKFNVRCGVSVLHCLTLFLPLGLLIYDYYIGHLHGVRKKFETYAVFGFHSLNLVSTIPTINLSDKDMSKGKGSECSEKNLNPFKTRTQHLIFPETF